MSNSTHQLGSTATYNATQDLDREFLQRIEAGQQHSLRRRPRPAVPATPGDAEALHEEPEALRRVRIDGAATRQRQRDAIFNRVEKRARLFFRVHRTALRRELLRVDRGVRRLSLPSASSTRRVTGCSAGRREARPGHRRSAASSRTAARSRGGGDGPGSEPPGDGAAAFDDDDAIANYAAQEPGGGSGDGGSGDAGGGLGSGPPEGDGGPSDDEFSIRRAASRVATSHPSRLTPGLLKDVTEEFVSGLNIDEKAAFRGKVLLALPFPLRMSCWSEFLDQVLREAEGVSQ